MKMSSMRCNFYADLSRLLMFVTILASTIQQIAADSVKVEIDELVKEDNHCYKYQSGEKYLSITHSRVLYLNGKNQIVGNAMCVYEKNKVTTCDLLGVKTDNSYLFISVTLLKESLSVDVDYRYNDKIMGLSKITDPRKVFKNATHFPAKSHMYISNIAVDNTKIKVPSCHDNFAKLLIADHGLYITKVTDDVRWESMYFEPYGLGEYLITDDLNSNIV